MCEFLCGLCGVNFDNLEKVDASEAEQKLRTKAPGILSQDEHLELAYKLRSQKLFFTPKRILLKYKRKVTMLPYTSVGMFEVQPPIGSMDVDFEVRLVCKAGRELSFVTRDFSAKKADILEVLGLLNKNVLPSIDPFGIADQVIGANIPPPTMPDTEGLINFLRGDARELDQQGMEMIMKPFLHPHEKVRLTYKARRDITLFTTKRVMFIDKSGILGKRIKYTSVLWKHVRMFSVETTPGNMFDRDSEFNLYTDLPAIPVLSQELRKECDVLKIQSFLCDVTCGHAPPAMEANTQNMGGGDNQSGGIIGLIKGEGNAGQIDAREATAEFSRPPNNILTGGEAVEMAFKGKRDYMLFTNRRIIFVDNKKVGLFGMGGKKAEYLSVPYAAISHFAVQTAGGGFIFKDRDSELQLWTDCCEYTPERPPTDKDEGRPPLPGKCYFEQDLAKDKVDLLGIHRYLSEKLLSLPEFPYAPRPRLAAPKINRPSIPGETNLLNRLQGWFSDNAREVDPNNLNTQFHSPGSELLQDDEAVCLAFACGRDLCMLTTKRIFFMDTQGFSGKKVQYLTIPYASVLSFKVQGASTFDSDCELKIETKGFWNTQEEPKKDEQISHWVQQDLRKSKCDIISIHNFLSERCVLNWRKGGDAFSMQVPHPVPQFKPGMGSNFLSFFDRDNMMMLSSAELQSFNSSLRSDPPLLLPSETIELGFQRKRDLVLFTNCRLLHVDRRKSFFGLVGSSMCYESVPWGAVKGFGYKSAGAFLDSDSEMILFCERSIFGFDIKKGGCDQGMINNWLEKEILTSRAALQMQQPPQVTVIVAEAPQPPAAPQTAAPEQQPMVVQGEQPPPYEGGSVAVAEAF